MDALGSVARARTGDLSPLFGLAAFGLMLSATSAFLGGVWDIMWHEDVGPDTFFTAPHLLLYAGAAGAGLTSLAVVLICTWRARRAGNTAPDGAAVPILGRTFWGPVGFIMAGSGSALYILSGMYDLWWHTVYGFDAKLGSPPHVGLGLSDVLTMAGGIVVFAMLVVRSREGSLAARLASAGLFAATAIFLLQSASWQVSFVGEIAAGVDAMSVFVAALYALALLMVVSVVRTTGAATLTALLFTALLIGGWVFATWATYAYADAIGLFPRDNAFGFPRIVAVLPKFVLPAAVVVDLVVYYARRYELPVRRGVLLAGAASMPLLLALEYLLPTGIVAPSFVAALASVLVAAPVGAVFAWAGWQLGVLLRRISRASAPSPTRKTKEVV